MTTPIHYDNDGRQILGVTQIDHYDHIGKVKTVHYDGDGQVIYTMDCIDKEATKPYGIGVTKVSYHRQEDNNVADIKEIKNVTPKYEFKRGIIKTTPKKETRSEVTRYVAKTENVLCKITNILGSRGTGCHTIFNELYSLICDQIDETYLYTTNENHRYSMVETSNVFNNLDSLKSLSDIKDNKTSRVLIFDNMDTNKLWLYKNIFMNSRHLNLTIFIISKHGSCFPALRANIDYSYIMKGYQYSAFDQLGKYVSNLNLFKSIYQSLHDYGMVVYNNNNSQFYHYETSLNYTNLTFNSKGPYEQIYQVDQNNILNTISIIVGKKKIGKSTLMRSLYSYICNDINEFYVLSNLRTNDYNDLTSEDNIFDDLSDFDTLINTLKNKNGNKLLLIDHFDMNILCKNKNFNYLMINGRHINLTIFILDQHLPHLTPQNRAQIDRLFIMPTDDLIRFKNKYDGYILDWLLLNTMHTQLKAYESLVIDYTSINQVISKYRHPYPIKTLPKKNLSSSKLNESIDNILTKQINVSDILKLRSELKQLKSLCSKLLDNTADLI